MRGRVGEKGRGHLAEEVVAAGEDEVWRVIQVGN